jgi:hypothetical protein
MEMKSVLCEVRTAFVIITPINIIFKDVAVPWLRSVLDPGSVLMSFVVNKEALGQVLFPK